MRIEEIKKIELGSKRIKYRDDLKDLVELPCLEACLNLYDKNIFTYWSSANVADNVQHNNADIGILYNYLSDENKEIAKRLTQAGIMEFASENSWGLGKGEIGLHIKFPINRESTVKEISSKFIGIVEHFQPQDVLYGIVTSEESNELANNILRGNVPPEEVRDVLEWQGYYYDEEENIYWLSEELYTKHKDYLNNQKVPHNR